MLSEAPPVRGRTAGRVSVRLRQVLQQLPEGGPEQQAIEAGEVDAVLDYAHSNVVLFPSARRALRAAAQRVVPAPAQGDAPVANSLLAALPRAEIQRLLAGLEPINLHVGEVLHEPGGPIRYVYFPLQSVVCLMAKAEAGQAVEVGLVGHEGMVGISLALGVDVSSARAVVHSPGTALRMKASVFQEELSRCKPLRRELYRYAFVKLTMARQAAVCIASHNLEQRLACWLLMTSDRVRSPDIDLTQETLASTLNVRRSTVTLASISLRSRKLIEYNRGKIRILNRKSLESASCSCYRRIEALHD